MSEYGESNSGVASGNEDAGDVLLVDDPLPGVRRLTMNRPEKRNSLIHPLRGAILEALREADMDPTIKVSIIRGAGPSFSAGYDLAGGNEGCATFFTADGEGQWPRHVTEGWMSIWDLAKPVIAQVHGYCLAGGVNSLHAVIWFISLKMRKWVTLLLVLVFQICISIHGF